MNFPDFVQIASIVVICYLIGVGIRLSPLDNKWIPLIVGICGGILGVVGMYAIPNFPYQNFMDAIAGGIVSGFAATGIDQAFRVQMD